MVASVLRLPLGPALSLSRGAGGAFPTRAVGPGLYGSLVALALSIVGGTLNVGAAVWLLVAPFPEDLEATGWSHGLPGVRKVLRQQRGAAGVVAVGTGLQLLAVVLAP